MVHKVPTINLYAHGVQLFDSDSSSDFAILQSSAHEYWARFNSGSLGQTLRYTASKCWATLPWPESVSDETAEVANQLLHLRSDLMARRGCGSNSIYDEFHNPNHRSTDIDRLREMHQLLDRMVMVDYGWSDIDTKYQEIAQGRSIRLSIPEKSRRELIRRLILLNGNSVSHVGKKKSKALKATRMASPDQSTFNFESVANEVGNGLLESKSVVEFLREQPGWHAKAEILEATGLSDGKWNTAIAELIASGAVERQGERRGARYRVKSGGAS